MRRILLCFIAVTLAAQEKPVQLLRGMGTHSHPIATRNPEVQKYFDQGLVLLYGFNRYEALRSFSKASALDPKAIMPHWGMAAALAPHINMDLDQDVDMKKACEHGKQAAALDGPAHEKAYAAVAAAMCQGEAAHRTALRALSRNHPDDPDAATLFAESLMVAVRWRWWKDAKPAGEMALAIRTLEQVMKRDPDHPGANHFYVHAMEMSPNPEYALPSAQRLMGGIAPGAGHLVHMAGHIYLRTGDYEVVASSNERAIHVDEDYFHHTGVHGGYMGYYAHNLHFLTYARTMQGRYEDALAAANKMVETAQPLVKEAPAMIDAFLPTPYFVMARFQKWDEILALPKVENDKLPVTRTMLHYVRALAFLGKQQRDKAQAEMQAFETARKAVPPTAIWINNKAADVIAVAALVLEGRSSKAPAQAAIAYRKAVLLQDNLVYDEPPPFYYPVRESLGAALLAAGDARGAEAAFRDDLTHNPRNPRSLFGLWRALDKQGRTADVIWIKTEFDKAWKKAQVSLRLEDL
ncbi:MAG: hypothetical protein JST93_27490 [Acidobacteria bacterium]|nr:hypothetical protein [Acidobacteriota bacterium]